MDNSMLEQERVYKPTGFEDLEDSTNIEDLDDNKQETDDMGESPVEGNKFITLLKTINPKILLIVGIAIVGIFIVAVFVGKKNLEKQKEQELLNRADEIISGEQVIVEEVFAYTAEEIEDLRLAGYTGVEIDDFEFEEIDAQSLIKSAEEARKAKYEAEIVPYLNSASDEFKYLESNTWVGLEKFDIPDDKENWQYYIETYNVDYQKVAAAGMQCFIKFYLPDGNVGFFMMSPDRYVSLADSGNMVIRVKYCAMSNGINVITNVEEILVE